MALQPARIVVIDDDSYTRAFVIDVLADNPGCSVVGFGTGAEAMAVLSTVQPDLIVLDIRPGATDGVTLYRLIRASAGLATVPVLLTSTMSKGQFDEQIGGLEGPYKQICKPFDLDMMDTLVTDLLSDESN